VRRSRRTHAKLGRSPRSQFLSLQGADRTFGKVSILLAAARAEVVEEDTDKVLVGAVHSPSGHGPQTFRVKTLRTLCT